MCNPAISILIPVYNGGSYLCKALDSVLAQSFDNFEIVCVDDLSSDNSVSILREYARKDARVRIIERSDKGGYAVTGIMYGLPYCRGQYFFFMSQDDLMDRNCLEAMYSRACEVDADVVLPDMVWYFSYKDIEDNEKITAPSLDYGQVISGQDAFDLAVDWDIHGFALKKMSLVRSIGYDDLYFNGCEYGTRTHYLHAVKVAFVKSNFYYRQDNGGAITKNFKIFIIEDFLTNIRILRLMKNFGSSTDKVKYFFRKTIRLANMYRKQFFEHFNEFSRADASRGVAYFRKGRWELLELAISLGLWGEVPHILKATSLSRLSLFSKIRRRLRPSKAKAHAAVSEMHRPQARDVGRFSYCGNNCYISNPETKIGSFVSIAANVFIGPSEHPTNLLSTSPYFYVLPGLREIVDPLEIMEPCEIGNDVWIGDNVFIKHGVKIGHGAVVGAGAVVTKDVPDYAVVIGVPAKVLRYRFNENIISDLLELKWWDLPNSVIKDLPFYDVEKSVRILKRIRTGSEAFVV